MCVWSLQWSIPPGRPCEVEQHAWSIRWNDSGSNGRSSGGGGGGGGGGEGGRHHRVWHREKQLLLLLSARLHLLDSILHVASPLSLFFFCVTFFFKRQPGSMSRPQSMKGLSQLGAAGLICICLERNSTMAGFVSLSCCCSSFLSLLHWEFVSPTCALIYQNHNRICYDFKCR